MIIRGDLCPCLYSLSLPTISVLVIKTWATIFVLFLEMIRQEATGLPNSQYFTSMSERVRSIATISRATLTAYGYFGDNVEPSRTFRVGEKVSNSGRAKLTG